MDRSTTPRSTTDETHARAAGMARTTDATGAPRLAHLDQLDDYKVADGEPDIRGWTVKTADGRRVGKVEDLLVDCAAMKVRYMEVELDRKALDLTEDRHVLVPIGTARLDDDDDVVLVSRPAPELAGMPAYTRGSTSTNDERTMRDRYAGSGPSAAGASADRGTGDLYGGRHFDDDAFFGKRRRQRDGATYLTRSEEELAVGTRRVEAGAVEVRKTVETEHVRETVPVMHEEARVERRPISGHARGAQVEIGRDEIRVPLMAEEVVAEKRVEPKEELVIRKEAVRGEQTVEADLRRERIDVDDATRRGTRDRR